MSSAWKITSLNENNEQEFMLSIRKNKLLHIFTLFDLKKARDKTEIWIASRNQRKGYLIQFDKKIIHTHGDSECLPQLLKKINVQEAKFAIEPQHLAQVEELYVPTKASDAASLGNITAYLIMSVRTQDFNLSTTHQVTKATTNDLGDIFRDLGEEYGEKVRQAQNSGIALGVRVEKRWVSVAIVPEIIEEIGFIRGVYTDPAFRGKGFSTSTMSALVKELFRLHVRPGLWVAEDNAPAVRVYKKIGFKPSKNTLLGFTAKKKYTLT
jgi:GNAT superfamily N-acetyltransferase